MMNERLRCEKCIREREVEEKKEKGQMERLSRQSWSVDPVLD